MCGWLISLVMHTLAAGIAILLMNDLHLAKQPEPFQWEVSVAQSSVPQGPEVPSPPTPQPAITQETSPSALVETRSIATKPAATSTTEVAVTESEHSVVQSPPMVEQEVLLSERIP
jgi:hypothetical protein